MASDGALPAALEPKNKGNVKFAFACAILASMTSILLGYDIGVMSGASLYIKKDLNISDVKLEVLMGILNVYSLIGSFAAGRTSDWIGRRYTIVLAAVIFFAGAFLMGFAVNYGMLMFGRFVAGVGVGYALMIAPVYTAEVSPASARGFLTSFPEVFINFGILLGYVSNYAFAGLPLHLGWRVMLGIGAAPSVVLALMVLGMPESPRWLVMKGRLADAKVVLGKTSDTAEEAAERLADIKAAAGIPANLDGDVVTVPNREGGDEESRVWRELILSPTPAMRRILLSGIGIHFFQQASGIDAVVLYSPRVFKAAGITDDKKLLGTTCAVGVTKTLFILVATFLLDRVGRRPLLLSSVAGMILSLALLGMGLTVVGHNPDTKVPWAIGMAIASTMAYVAFFSIGLGPITWVYSSEIFPLHVRGHQPRHQRRGLHDLHLPVQRHHHRRRLLPLRRRGHARLRVLLLLPPGNPRPDAGGDGQTVRHDRRRNPEARSRRRREREAAAGDVVGRHNHNKLTSTINRITRGFHANSKNLCSSWVARQLATAAIVAI